MYKWTGWSISVPLLVKAETEEEAIEKLKSIPHEKDSRVDDPFHIYIASFQDKEIMFIPSHVVNIKGYKRIDVPSCDIASCEKELSVQS